MVERTKTEFLFKTKKYNGNWDFKNILSANLPHLSGLYPKFLHTACTELKHRLLASNQDHVPCVLPITPAPAHFYTLNRNNY